MNDDRFAELVAGRALDALEPGDDAILDAHLADCSDCRGLLDELRTTATNLAHGVDDHEPPPELLDKIRAALPSDAHRAPIAEVVSLPRRSRRPLSPSALLPRVAAGVAAAAVLTAGGYALHTRSDQRRAQGSLSQSQQVLEHLQDAGAYAVSLKSQGAATGTAVVDGRRIDLITTNLGRNDAADSQYVLWVGSGTDPVMVAVVGFDVTRDGQIVVPATLPAGVSAPTVFDVTHERGRALPAAPGGSPVLGVQSSSAGAGA